MIPLRVYVACAYSERATARKFAAELATLGDFEIVSTWHDAPDEVEDRLTKHERTDLWEKNAADMERCEVLACPTLIGYPRSTFAEIGFVLALGESVVVNEPGRHDRLPLLCYAQRVTRAKSWSDMLAVLVTMREARR